MEILEVLSMKQELTNGGLFIVSITCLYSTGHWIGATVLMAIFVLYNYGFVTRRTE
jgi:hypothetical protein